MALSSEAPDFCPSHLGAVSNPPLARGPDGFERTVGLILSRMAQAPKGELIAAVGDSLRDLCRIGGLGLASVLEPLGDGSGLAVRIEATVGNVSAGSLITASSEHTHQRVRSELAWSSPCVIDADDPQPDLSELGAALRAHGLKSCAIARLDLEGRPFGCLVLASNSRNLLDGATFSRVRLLADLMVLALARHDAVDSTKRCVGAAPAPMTEVAMRDLERNNLLFALESCGWKVQGPAGAARALGLSPSTLRDRMKSFGLKRP
jgi:transcriptional regulator with GAF, ATPase, and Fis domain